MSEDISQTNKQTKKISFSIVTNVCVETKQQQQSHNFPFIFHFFDVNRKPTIRFVHFPFPSPALPSAHLNIDESADVLEPADVLLLLLGINVVGDKDGQGLVDATLLEEALHQHLQVLVEAAKGRAGVDVGALLGGLGGVDAGDGGVLVEEHVVDDDFAVAGGGVDVEGAVGLAGLLDQDGQVDRCAGVFVGLAVEDVVGVLLLVGLEGLFGELVLLEEAVLGVGVEICDVSDGEADGDSAKKGSFGQFSVFI